MDLGVPPAGGCGHQHEVLQTLQLTSSDSGFITEAQSLISSFPVPLPSQRIAGRAGSAQPLTTARSFWWPTSIPKPSGSPPRVLTSQQKALNPFTQEIARDLGAQCQELRSNTK